MKARGCKVKGEETWRLREQHEQSRWCMEVQGACSVRDLGVNGSNEAEKKVEPALQETYRLCQALNLIPWDPTPQTRGHVRECTKSQNKDEAAFLGINCTQRILEKYYRFTM